MRISKVKVYNFKEALIASGYPMSTEISDDRELVEQDFVRINKLAKAKAGSGHDCALKGILVTFDLTFSQAAWQQFQRYHFADIISSQSKMHRVTHMDLDDQVNDYVDQRVISIVREYLSFHDEFKREGKRKEAQVAWLRATYNLPVGFELTASVTTNYLQLKTMYDQRKKHKLPEWQEFCADLEALPYSHLFTGKEVQS